MKLCFVVHRYAPFAGGSEYNVQWMAEECVARGHEVTVFAGEHQGDWNGVKVTSSGDIFKNPFDLIIIHGGDVYVQNAVIEAIPLLSSPVLYLIIKPSHSPICQFALTHATYIGCCTEEDWEHVRHYGVESKAISIRYGINPTRRTGIKGAFRQKYQIDASRRMFLSCGGYWPNKLMRELAHIFNTTPLNNALLVTTGYDNRMNLMPERSTNVYPLMLKQEQDVANAMVDADVYIMHSSEEGFGLVLLECMLNRTPWIARNIAAARLMKEYGSTYETDEELISILRNFDRSNHDLNAAYDYVKNNHLISNTVDNIETCINHSRK